MKLPLRKSVVGLASCVFLGFQGILLSLHAQSSVAPGQQPPPEEAAAAQQKVNAEYLAKLDAVPGFGGIAFGADIGTFKKDLKVEQDRGPLVIYKKDDANLKLGSALLDEVLYYFYEGTFYGVAFHTDDGQDTLALKEVFQFAFGPGQSPGDAAPTTAWIGKKNGAIFDINLSSGEGSAFIFDQKIHDQYLTYQSQAAEKAAAALLKGE